MDDPAWIRSCEALSRHLTELERKTSIIRRSTNKVVTVRDIAREHERVKQTTSVANATDVRGVQDELRLLQRFVQLSPALGEEGARLMQAAQGVLQQYQATREEFFQRCMRVEAAARDPRDGAEAEAAEGGAETDGLLAGAETQRMLFERDLQAEIMAERQRETQELASNIQDINEIFSHMNELLGEQGVQLEMVESNVQAAEGASRRAGEHLRDALRYQQAGCNRFVYFIILFLFALVVFLLLMG